MSDTCDPPDDLTLLEAIAAALHQELGMAIEEQPSFQQPNGASRVNPDPSSEIEHLL
jgi:hypothetical protein